MMTIRCLLVALPIAVSLPAQGAPTDAVASAIANGSVKVSFRYRYEMVDDASLPQDANANTVRSRLTFAPRFNHAWSATVEFDDVRHIASARFSDTRNNKTAFPTVLDPEGTDLNQAFISYSGLADVALSLGRQRVNRGNQRFIGGVGWRQNEQTYDAFHITYAADSPVGMQYTYVSQINRIFGPEQGMPLRRLDSASHLLDLQYNNSELLEITAYGYLLDIEDTAAFSSETYGLRAQGNKTNSQGNVYSYSVEFAKQGDFADNPVSFDADYLHLEASAEIAAVKLTAGYEALGGADTPGGGFRTPLATLHKFQGWADKFAVATAAGLDSGLVDTSVGIAIQPRNNRYKASYQLVYHDFRADKGSNDLGSEIDLSASWSFNQHYSLLLKLARYDGKNGMTDLDKVWLQLMAGF